MIIDAIRERALADNSPPPRFFFINGRSSNAQRELVMQRTLRRCQRDADADAAGLASPGRATVLLAHISSAAEALNLQHFDTGFIPTPHWNPAAEDQAVGRLRRIGQTRQVHIHSFCILDGHGDVSTTATPTTAPRQLLDDDDQFDAAAPAAPAAAAKAAAKAAKAAAKAAAALEAALEARKAAAHMDMYTEMRKSYKRKIIREYIENKGAGAPPLSPQCDDAAAATKKKIKALADLAATYRAAAAAAADADAADAEAAAANNNKNKKRKRAEIIIIDCDDDV